MPKIEKVDDGLLRWELLALSKVLKLWSHERMSQRRAQRLSKKTVAFRKAVITGLGSGIREDVPHELVADEYDLVHAAMMTLWERSSGRKGSRWNGTDVVYETKTGGPVKRPLPWSDKAHRSLQRRKMPSPKCARELTAGRLGMKPSTVWDALKDKNQKGKPRYRTARPTLEQKLLASVFLDLNSRKYKIAPRRRQARILDALLLSGYPFLKLYYLIQISSDLPKNISMGICSKSVVNALCEAVMPKGTPLPGPFTLRLGVAS